MKGQCDKHGCSELLCGCPTFKLEDRSEKLLELCERFVRDQKIRCEETIHQTDRVILNAPEFIEKVCEIVGYHNDGQEDSSYEDEEDDE